MSFKNHATLQVETADFCHKDKPAIAGGASGNYSEGVATVTKVAEQLNNSQLEDDYSDLSEDEFSSSPSVLKIMAKNHNSISQTVSLIHKEAGKFNVMVESNVVQTIKSLTSEAHDDYVSKDIKERDGSDVVDLTSAIGKTKISSGEIVAESGKAGSSGSVVNDKKLLVQNKEIEGLSSFLGDANVQQLIKSVAGGETTSFIDKTLEAVKTSKSIHEKRAIVTGGIRQLHSDLLVNKDKIARDPLFSLALGVAGINRRSINFD